MKKVLFLSSLILLTACKSTPVFVDKSTHKQAINNLLDQWHKDVATYDFEAYFAKMTADAVFVGTDASEVWSKQEFMNFSKPFFDKKSTWDFTPLQRNVYLKGNTNIAWFDEVLNTWMGVCRGSGVVIYNGDKWQIQHYVLSVTVPNEDIQPIIKIKKERDSLFVKSLN